MLEVDSLVGSFVGGVVFGSGGGTFTGPLSLMYTRFSTCLDRYNTQISATILICLLDELLTHIFESLIYMECDGSRGQMPEIQLSHLIL